MFDRIAGTLASNPPEGVTPERAAELLSEMRASMVGRWKDGIQTMLCLPGSDINDPRAEPTESETLWWKIRTSSEFVATNQDKPDIELLPLEDYDYIVVAFSGGKDSVACALILHQLLKDRGIDPATRMELWHHDVDGAPDAPPVFDWPCTDDYCRQFAAWLKVPYLTQYRKGGIYGEMMRENACAQSVVFELLDGRMADLDDPPPEWNKKPRQCQERFLGTRLKYPARQADLRTRWCTSSVKIDVMGSALANDPRFRNKKTLIVTGERRQESANRARYAATEVHRSNTARRGQWRKSWEVFVKDHGPDKARVDAAIAAQSLPMLKQKEADALRKKLIELGATVGQRYEWFYDKPEPGKKPTPTNRYIDWIRPVINFSEADVWKLFRKHGIVPHPCYHLGFSRASCAMCIFLKDNDLATLREVAAPIFDFHADLEVRLEHTIAQDGSIVQRANQGQSRVNRESIWPRMHCAPGAGKRWSWDDWERFAMSREYEGPIVVDPDHWDLPVGAFKESGGPW